MTSADTKLSRHVEAFHIIGAAGEGLLKCSTFTESYSSDIWKRSSPRPIY